jgi:hypothetical protein
MTDDELLALYGSMKEMAAAMKAREAALDAKTAALSAAIAQLGRLPETLGKQTSQYIAMGVRQSIQDDFSRPIADAVKGPIAELSRETYHAREIMAQVGKESRFQTWNSITVMVLLGVILGAFGSYFFFNRELGHVDDRLDSMQQMMTPPAPTPGTKPVTGTSAKGHHGH